MYTFFSPPPKLSCSEEQALLETVLILDGPIRDFIIDCRILMAQQPIKNFQALEKHAKDILAPALIRRYEQMHGVSLSKDFAEALHQTIIQTIRKKHNADAIFEIHKAILNKYFQFLPAMACEAILLGEHIRINQIGEQVGFFKQEDAKQIFDAQYKRLTEVFLKLYPPRKPIFNQSLLLGGLLYYTKVVTWPWVLAVVALLNYQNIYQNITGLLTLNKRTSRLLISEAKENEILQMHEFLYRFKKIAVKHDEKTVVPLELEFCDVPAVLTTEQAVPDNTPATYVPPPPEPTGKKKHKRTSQHKSQHNTKDDKKDLTATAAASTHIAFTEHVGYKAEFKSNDQKNNTCFPIERCAIEDTFYVAINPALKDEMKAEEWAKFTTAIRNIAFVGPHGKQGIKNLSFIVDPVTNEKLMCYELKVLGAHGNKRLLGAIRVREEISGKTRCLIEFNTYCDQAHQPGKLARSMKKVLKPPNAPSSHTDQKLAPK